MVSLFSVVVLFLVAVYPVLSDTCPEPEDISPCSCSIFLRTVTLTCQKVNISLADLKGILYAFDKEVGIGVELQEMNLGVIPSDFFDGFNIKQLKIAYCELDSLAEEGKLPLSGLVYTLERLGISESFTQGKIRSKLDLSHLQRLTELNLYRNRIPELGNDWFVNGPSQLKRLTLIDNGIQILGDRAFANLPNLENLIIIGNRFGQMKRSMIPYPVNNLESLSLDENALTSLPENFLAGMPSLMFLHLDNNEFTKIPQRTFQPLWKQLLSISMIFNPLACDDADLQWMVEANTTVPVFGLCQSPPDRKYMPLSDVVKTMKDH